MKQWKVFETKTVGKSLRRSPKKIGVIYRKLVEDLEREGPFPYCTSKGYIRLTPGSLLREVKEHFPELSQLPKRKLRVVEKALIYASRMIERDELLSESEHRNLMAKLEGKGGITPGYSLKAYRWREDLTQQELSRRSGMTQANISAMERGKRSIGLRVAKKLATVLGCDYKRLI